MLLAEYGLLPGEYTSDEGGRLVLAWVRRKRYEARLVAVEVGALLSGKPRQRNTSSSMTADEAWSILEQS